MYIVMLHVLGHGRIIEESKHFHVFTEVRSSPLEALSPGCWLLTSISRTGCDHGDRVNEGIDSWETRVRSYEHHPVPTLS